ncbi:MAG: serine hydrolase [Bacteroidetes bacterium]|nr:serine hydrolase [Bacteroidota bacterium]
MKKMKLRDFAINNLHISPVLFPFFFVKIFDHSAAMLKNLASTKEKITMPNLHSLLIAKSLTISFLITFLAITFTNAQPLSSLQIDSLVQASMERMPLAGIAVAVVKDGKVIHSKGYGVSSSESRGKVDKNTLFAIASNSKAFTSASLALLIEEGKLSWQDKVVDHIPEFKMYDPYVTANFNIQDLLTHRSGLGLGAGDLMFFPDGSDFTVKDVLNSFQYQEPVSAFRTKYDYDNLLYIVAGEVVARVSGMSWVDFVETRIMKPLGMYRSAGVFQRLTDKTNVALPHGVVDGKLVELETYTKADETLGAAGGIYASVNDLSKWLLMHLNGGKYGDELKNQLFSAQNQNEMWKPHTNIGFSVQPAGRYQSHFMSYGLGWVVRDRSGHIVVSHTGGLPGMLSRTIMIPELNLGIVVLTNTAPGGDSYYTIAQAIMDGYLGVEGRDWIDWASKNLAESQSMGDSVTTAVWKTIDSASSEHLNLKSFTGVFEDAWFGKVEISLKEGQLWFRSYRSPKLIGKMHYYKANTFAIKWNYRDMECDAFAIFNLDMEGKAINIKMKGISPNIDFSYDFQDLDLNRVED